MKTEDIQKILMDLMVGATVLSMKVAGPELEVFFTGGRSAIANSFSLDTDAWILIGKGIHRDRTSLKDEEFNAQRPAAIVGIYELTGHDVEAVSVSSDGTLDVTIGGKNVRVIPKDVNSPSPSYVEKDSWEIVIRDSKGGRHGYVGFYQGHGFKVRAPDRS